MFNAGPQDTSYPPTSPATDSLGVIYLVPFSIPLIFHECGGGVADLEGNREVAVCLDILHGGIEGVVGTAIFFGLREVGDKRR